MQYYHSRSFSAPFDAVVDATVAALSANGFGVLTDIDVAATMKKKIDKDLRPYRILGACNPSMAYEALQVEKRVGAMLPCNVIVFEADDGSVEVSAIDPVASMLAIENPDLKNAAEIVRGMLQKAVAAIEV